ncbi:MAG: heme NO-binding domain-containing protein [Methylococcaceae bacterium]|jgi:hypothetical protein
MKGIVFTEFLDFVKVRYSDDTVDDIIEASALASGGAYTSVGTYDHNELIQLCHELSKQTGVNIEDLIKDFGVKLSHVFAKNYAVFFSRCSHYFDFLESIEAHIHKEVRKLYPDAELPTFSIIERSRSRLIMDYSSPRQMSILAQGLLAGTASQFNVNVIVQAEPGIDDEQVTRFIIDLV